MIFQYQQRAAPIDTTGAGPTPPPAVELSWQPIYPDRVPHRRSITAPFSSVAPFIVGGVLPLRVSQLPAEVVFQYGSVLTRTSQLPVEIVFAYAQNIRWARVTQIAVEVVYPFGCYLYVPPLPEPCPVPNPEADGGVNCTAPVLGGGA